MKVFALEVPRVYWKDIGGYASVKKSLQECVDWPLRFSHFFQQLRIVPPRGVLLYGPPGCSKTMMAKAVATESHMNFITVKGPELFSKWVGESERAVREVFRRARQNAPCVIFFDEIDAMAGDRETGEAGGVENRVLSQMLNEMDGVGPIKEVVVIAATNRPDLLDAALLRPGRLDRLVYVPLPDLAARKDIVMKMLQKMPFRSRKKKAARVWHRHSLKVTQPSAGTAGRLKEEKRTQETGGAAEEPLSQDEQDVKRECLPAVKQGVKTSTTLPASRKERDTRPATLAGAGMKSACCAGGGCAIAATAAGAAGVASDEATEGAAASEIGRVEATTDEGLAECADWLANATQGYSGAEIVMICREASMHAVREAVCRVFLLEKEEAKSAARNRSAERMIRRRDRREETICSARGSFARRLQKSRPALAAEERKGNAGPIAGTRDVSSEQAETGFISAKREGSGAEGADDEEVHTSLGNAGKREQGEAIQDESEAEEEEDKEDGAFFEEEGDDKETHEEVFVENRHIKKALRKVRPRTPKSLLRFYERYQELSTARGGGPGSRM